MEEVPSHNGGSDDKASALEVENERPPKVTVFFTKTALWTAFALIYFNNFVLLLIANIALSLTPYVMSKFSGHGLISVVFMINRIVSGVLRLPLAKFIDTFGRLHGFLLTAGIIFLGLVLQAAAQNLATTAVAQVFQGIGWNFMDYVLTVLLADMTSLKNRSLAYGIFVTPTIATSFASPRIADSLYARISLRWVFGASAIIFFGLSSPLVIALVRAGRTNHTVGEASRVEECNRHRCLPKALRHFLVELDLPGIVLAIVGLCLILLPFNLASTFENGWRNTKLISMLAVGSLSIIAFIVWEKWLAPVTCITWDLLRNRNVLGGCLVVLFSAGSIGCWDAYYSSYLQVVHNQSITTSGYVTNAYILSFAISAPFLGILLRITGNYKYPALCAAPLLGTFTGFLLVFRTPETTLSLLFMCQVLIGISERALATSSLMSVSSSIAHKDIAITIGIWGAYMSIGMAVCLGVSGAIWTNVLPSALEGALPSDSKPLAQAIFESLDIQRRYPMGSPIRDAIIAAYLVTQRTMVIAGVCVTPLALGCIFMWKNIDLRRQEGDEIGTPRGLIW